MFNGVIKNKKQHQLLYECPKLKLFFETTCSTLTNQKKPGFLFFFTLTGECYVESIKIRNFRSQAKNDYIDKIREIILNSIM